MFHKRSVFFSKCQIKETGISYKELPLFQFKRLCGVGGPSEDGSTIIRFTKVYSA